MHASYTSSRIGWRASAPAIAVLAAIALGAHATVSDRGPGGFTTTHTVEINAPHARVYQATTEIGRWWDPEHTFSQDTAALSLTTVAGGCFCETLPSGGHVRHLSVVYADPNRVLRLTGGLGPLQTMAVTGSMELRFEATETGTTRLVFTYAVGGYSPGGLEGIADPVDQVLLGQLLRLKRYVETGRPDAPA